MGPPAKTGSPSKRLMLYHLRGPNYRVRRHPVLKRLQTHLVSSSYIFRFPLQTDTCWYSVAGCACPFIVIINYRKYNYSTEKEKSQTLRDGATSLALDLRTTVSSRVSDSYRQRRDERLSAKATGVEVVTVVRVDM